MSKGAISLRVDEIKKILDPEAVAKAAYPTFYKKTPIKTGNARKNTTVDKGEIRADYPYAQRLDQGYSRQSPGGMTRPTLDFIQSYIRKNIGKN